MVKNRLAEIIEEKGIKKSWLAEQVGITKSTMSTLIQNKYSTSIDIAFKLSRILKMDIKDIFYEVDETKTYIKIIPKLDKD
jgi:DNA-binding XRE family transcriptional regulator